jgi:hypothetical protein
VITTGCLTDIPIYKVQSPRNGLASLELINHPPSIPTVSPRKRHMIGETARLLAACLVLILIDAYIFWNHQDALRILFAIGINFVILLGCSTVSDITAGSGGDAVSRNRPRSLRTRPEGQEQK